MFQLADLPPPPPGYEGFPWTVASPIPSDYASPAWPKISIITPSYNQGAFLEATLRSVLLQGYPNLEYIVIDGASTDASRAILEKYHPYLSYWVSERDRGQTHAINKGFERSTGDLMAWLNSDDLLLPGALYQVARAYQGRPGLQVSCGWRWYIDEAGHKFTKGLRPLPTARRLRQQNVIAQETVFWRREVWEALGPLDESYHFMMDYEYWLRMVQAGYQFELLPAYLAAFREQKHSKTQTLRPVEQENLARLKKSYHLDSDRPLSAWERWEYRWWLYLSDKAFTDNPRWAAFLYRVLAIPPVYYLLVGGYQVSLWLRGRA
jgi:glycosyltransferase involved in cell wall biosynthesis